MEKIPTFERERKRPFEEKHNSWLVEAKIMLQSLGAGVGGTLAGNEILKAFGIQLPPEALPILGSAAVSFSLMNLNRLRNLKQKNG